MPAELPENASPPKPSRLRSDPNMTDDWGPHTSSALYINLRRLVRTYSLDPPPLSHVKN